MSDRPRIIHDSTRGWRVRFVDDEGARRSRSFGDREAALQFVATLKKRREAVRQHTRLEHVCGTEAVMLPLPTFDAPDSDHAWDAGLCWLRDQLLQATQVRDQDLVELVGAAARAYSALSHGHAQMRDFKKMERAYKTVKQQLELLRRAGRHGTRLESAAPVGSA